MGLGEGFANPVHPHACGENILAICGVLLLGGSPPRVWGKQLISSVIHIIERFTPTRVGKTSSASAG